MRFSVRRRGAGERPSEPNVGDTARHLKDGEVLAGVETVLIGIGANLPAEDGTSPLVTCRRALAALGEMFGAPPRVSSWYRSAPVPASDQPWFVNAVARFATDRPPREILGLLHAVERQFGRTRQARWAARTLDLDLLACGRAVVDEPGLAVPHPRLRERAFVLVPLAEVAPDWRHPCDPRPVADMVAALPANQIVLRLAEPGAPARPGAA